MRIAVIGAGNLATNIGVALHDAGHEILQVYSRTEKSADTLAKRLCCEAVTELERVCDDADIYIVAVKDSVIADIVPVLCNGGRKDAVFVHTAGSIGISVFDGYAIHYGVLYPMQTFSKARQVDFREIPCFIEGNDEKALTSIKTLAGSISESIYELSSEARKYLHLSAVFACNFVNYCYDIASEILGEHGISFDVMLPLIDETARKVHELPPSEAQTGPAVRYDENVMGSQKSLLAANSDFQKIYELMSKSIHETAEKKKKDD
ncbi:MAG: DUF2520 domain-containing protein [Prevotella sp.]|nr:DUF2520 domain-containing protein [Prevotella sp.]